MRGYAILSAMKTKTLPLGAIAANCILLWDETAPDKGCLVVDPGAAAKEELP